jgi:hypothetical protein
MTSGSPLDDSVTPLDGMAFGMASLAIEGFGCAIRLRLEVRTQWNEANVTAIRTFIKNA